MKKFTLFSYFILINLVGQSQSIKSTFSLEDTSNLKAFNVTFQSEKFQGKKSVKVIDAATNEDTELRFVKLSNATFRNGLIEVELAGEPKKNASEGARGFVGIAFRIDNSNSKFECFYLRPTNGRADN